MNKLVLWLIVTAMAMVLAACTHPFQPPPHLPACPADSSQKANLGDCRTLAKQGNATAMARLGWAYLEQNDPQKAYEWFRQAAEANDLPSLRKLFDDYRAGITVPRNHALADGYLQQAANLKAHWALLVLAKRAETSDPAQALATYQAMARDNNCFAQARLALAYFRGDIAPRNLTQAYFWSLLAVTAARTRHSDYHVDADLFSPLAAPHPALAVNCSDVPSIAPTMETETALPRDRRQMAQDAATAWLPGLTEPNLPPPDDHVQTATTMPPALPPVPRPDSLAVPFPAPDPNHLHGQAMPDRVALIIGVDHYENAPRASFAERDAAAFTAFAETGLGIAEDNRRTLLGHGARRLDVERALTTWLPSRLKPGGTVILYFAGHGLPTEDGGDLYLLPFDGDRDLLAESAIRRDRLIDRIKTAGAAQVIVILDACFAGQTRDGEPLRDDARPLVLVPHTGHAAAGVTLLSAAQGSELALSLRGAGHGLFTYMLLKGLEGEADANNDHRITMGELYRYVEQRVEQEAGRMNHKQTPVLEGDFSTVLAQW